MTNEHAVTFKVLGSDRVIDATRARVVVAGYTGADPNAVQHHIDELAAIGVPPPEAVPAFYPMPPGLVTQEETVTVDGDHSSGEVEPVLVRVDGELFLAVGSDHTDRDLERESIARAKEACPKPVSREVLPVPQQGPDRAATSVRSTVDGTEYQDGTLAALRPLPEVLEAASEHLALGDGDLIMFGGTVPLLTGTFRWGARWTMTLEVPGIGVLEHRYAVEQNRSP